MTTTKPLHTLNARGNVMLEVVRDYFKVPPERMFREIQALRHSVEEALALKGVKYDDLKSALVPDRKRKEMALVFDTLVIEDSWYGLAVFRRLIPLFSKYSNHSVFAGDYIDTGAGQALLFKAMRDAVTLTRNIDYKHSSQFYVIYINNLTDAMMAGLHEGLLCWGGYVGYADTTYASAFKTLLSTMLVNAFIKHGRTSSRDTRTTGRIPKMSICVVIRSRSTDMSAAASSRSLRAPFSPTRSNGPSLQALRPIRSSR
jgi:hypothetical protein